MSHLSLLSTQTRDAFGSALLHCEGIALARLDRNAGMRRTRVTTARSKRASDTPSRQLALPIGNTSFERFAAQAIRSGGAPAARGRRPIETDQILTTADVVNMTQTDRTTLYRWIKRSWFCPKTIRYGHPVGWSKSDIDRLDGTGARCAHIG
jgi:predicted DNA-binding transcriptional regulator AlpA